MDEIVPIFIIGAPRSGTTLIGNYIGSSSNVCDLGEYFGFAFTLNKLETLFKKVPSNFKTDYIKSLQEHAVDFTRKVSIENDCKFFCDSTPWNSLVLDQIQHFFPNALFVLMIRHYSGLIQSLERSFNDGYAWAGENLVKRAVLYSDIYSNVLNLPRNNTFPLSYDMLCYDPLNTISELNNWLLQKGIDIESIDETCFSNSYASNPHHKRKSLASLVNSELVFRQIPSFESENWSVEIEQRVYSIVGDVVSKLSHSYPDVLIKPNGFYY